MLTEATDVIVRIPPAPPITSLTSPVPFTTIAGDIDDSGLFPGDMKLALDDGVFVMLGMLKAVIWLFKSIPVLFDITPEPKLKSYFLMKNTNKNMFLLVTIIKSYWFSMELL